MVEPIKKKKKKKHTHTHTHTQTHNQLVNLVILEHSRPNVQVPVQG